MDLKAMRLLLENGAKINDTNREGQTALHVAAGAGQEEAVRFLCEMGADVDIADKEGNTARDLAVRKGFGGIADILLQASHVLQ
ncbi:ankyrin repeat protein [Wilcoxina mikolae CBS 423.85]|nr:ankyrin repeat protein [Wilcoxina mikolae CBS 423.85]